MFQGFVHLMHIARVGLGLGSLSGFKLQYYGKSCLCVVVEWLYMLKAWVASEGKKTGLPCSFGHCYKNRASLSVPYAWLISTCTRSCGSALSTKVQIPKLHRRTGPCCGCRFVKTISVDAYSIQSRNNMNRPKRGCRIIWTRTSCM